jgi:hypothetical protein
MNVPKTAIDNDYSIAKDIAAERQTGYIEFQINRYSPSIAKIYNWSFKSL